jgi:putative SOS response-associated peptidase YedK
VNEGQLRSEHAWNRLFRTARQSCRRLRGHTNRETLTLGWHYPSMCNDYERHVSREPFNAALDSAGLTLISSGPQPALAPAADVRVGDTAPVLVTEGNGVALVPMRWGFSPSRLGGAPVFNFRGDGRRFGTSQRCVIPASAFFEFTGTRSPKSKWRFTVPSEQVFGIAGLWHREAGDAHFTMLTVEPGPDVRPFHDRQIAILRPAEWGHWLYLSKPEAELIRLLPSGSLAVDLARPGVEAPAPELMALADARAPTT